MNEYISRLIQKYRNAGVLLDTNILLLYFVGSIDPQRIVNFKRTYNRGFIEEDFYTLMSLLKQFKRVVTTPNILTEVGNFLGQLPEYLHSTAFERFGSDISTLDEHYLASSEMASMPAFNRLGLTDSGIIQLAKRQFLVVTEDFKLSQYSQQQGVDALNFNHIRPLGWK